MIKNNKQVFPSIPADLLEELDRIFPERSPDFKWSEKDCFWNGGQRSVVRFLHQQFQIQNENILTKE
tara:strand:+ start:123 stop:323 length:201 start_codon:yes stop_codon:yes gene_type:complete